MLDFAPTADPAEAAAIVRSWWDRATPAERRHGRLWYRRARAWCETRADAHDVEVPAVAGIVGACSPRTSYRRNLAEADLILETRTGRVTFPGQVSKALRILDGEPWDAVLTGPKERPFTATILDERHPHLVADTWMGRLFLPPWAWFDDGMVKRVLARVGPRRAIEEGFMAVADDLGVLLSVLQATTWCVIRGGAD